MGMKRSAMPYGLSRSWAPASAAWESSAGDASVNVGLADAAYRTVPTFFIQHSPGIYILTVSWIHGCTLRFSARMCDKRTESPKKVRTFKCGPPSRNSNVLRRTLWSSQGTVQVRMYECRPSYPPPWPCDDKHTSVCVWPMPHRLCCPQLRRSGDARAFASFITRNSTSFHLYSTSRAAGGQRAAPLCPGGGPGPRRPGPPGCRWGAPPTQAARRGGGDASLGREGSPESRGEGANSRRGRSRAERAASGADNPHAETTHLAATARHAALPLACGIYARAWGAGLGEPRTSRSSP